MADSRSRRGTFVTFFLGGEEHACDVFDVIEVTPALLVTGLPGASPAIAGVVERASMDGIEVVGLKRGWQALAIRDNDHHIVNLGPEIIREYSRLAGSKLQCSRTNPVKADNDRTDIVRDNMKKFKLDAIIAIGGEDTLGAADVLSSRGVPVVGIPKTIDRDLAGTEYTLGYDTALNVICESAERIASFTTLFGTLKA